MARERALALHDFLQLIVPVNDMRPRRDLTCNADLVSSLKKGMLHSETVAATMLCVPRGNFVPPEQAEEAWIDAPIHVASLDFNISAPHMHACMLEALELVPGDRVLDVGCGCGYVAACAAYLVGSSGSVHGVDIKQACVDLSAANIAALRRDSRAFGSAACEVTLERCNVFMPSDHHRRAYNKVHVGGSCPEERVPLLLALLAPSGGRLLVPVESELRVYEVGADGRATHRQLSMVRFSELEVPTDAEIALAALAAQQAWRLAVVAPPATLLQDLSPLLGAVPSPGASLSPRTPSKLPTPPSKRTLLQALACAAAAAGGGCAGGGGDAEASASAAGGCGCERGEASASASARAPAPAPAEAVAALCERLPPKDVTLVGAGWQLTAHREVLRARCEHFRARCGSGMRDADGAHMDHMVPEHFGQTSVEAFLTWVYEDRLPSGLEPAQVSELLHVAAFYGAAPLTRACEGQLAAQLSSLDPSHGAAEAPALLALADELGLADLARVAAAYMARHYEAACASEGWQLLSRRQVEAVASELALQLATLRGALAELAPEPGAAPKPRRRPLW